MTVFKGIEDIGRPSFTDVLSLNLINYLDYGFTDIGGYFNISKESQGQYGGNKSVLRPVNDPRFPSNKVWQARRKNWVWEQDVSVGSPVQISGVYINDTLVSSGYNIDYRNGRVVFDNAVPPSSKVQIEYSYKWLSVDDTQNLPINRRFDKDSFRFEDSNFIVGSGSVNELSETRVQMPFVGVNVLEERMSSPYEIGSYSTVTKNRIMLNVFSESKTEARKIADIICAQENRTIPLYDPYLMTINSGSALDHRGYLQNQNSVWKNLVKPSGDGGFLWQGSQNGNTRITKCVSEDGDWLHEKMYQITVRLTTETVLHN